MKTLSRASPNAGFTLLELLTVIAVLALLASCLLPALQRAKARARATMCLGNLHQFGLATASYALDAGRLPSFLGWLYGPARGTQGDVTAGQLYPYINTKRVYLCPTQPATVTNPNGQFQADHSYAVNCMTCHAHDVTACSAPARTVYMVEGVNLATNWWGSIAEPDPIPPAPPPGFPHRGRANLLMMDGHVIRPTQAEFQAKATEKAFWYPNDATNELGSP
jgi:prepilin-type N-terminal cleavage/methylation domain-containing protein/prepilin-type processing-associated H-X9-DG protein